MTTLLLTIALLVHGVNNWIVFPSSQYFVNDDGTALVIQYGTPNIISPDKWFVDAKLASISHDEFLRVMAEGWLKNYNLSDFAQLSAKYKPTHPTEPPPAPEPPAKWIGYTVGGKVHLYIDCRYIAGKDSKEIEITETSDICLTCIARIGQ